MSITRSQHDESEFPRPTAVIGQATGRPVTLDAIPELTDDSYRLVGQISKLRSLGFRPAISLLDGVAQLADLLGPSPDLPSVEQAFRREQLAVG